MKQPEPLVTIVITARNRPDELSNTLKILRLQTYPNIEMLVIDDASDEPLEPVVRDIWPEASVYRNAQNLGLIASRSLSFKLAKGDFIASLDDDSYFMDPTDLKKAVLRFEQERDLGILTFQVLVSRDPAPGPVQRHGNRYSHIFFGCAHMMRREVQREVGGYCDFFFYYIEEAEYSMRVIQKGWKIYYFTDIVVQHHVSPVDRSHAKILRYCTRNGLWLVFMRFPLSRIPAELIWRLTQLTMRGLREGCMEAVLHGICEAAGGLPGVLRLREPLDSAAMRQYELLRLGLIVRREDFETQQHGLFRSAIRRIIHGLTTGRDLKLLNRSPRDQRPRA